MSNAVTTRVLEVRLNTYDPAKERKEGNEVGNRFVDGHRRRPFPICRASAVHPVPWDGGGDNAAGRRFQQLKFALHVAW